VEDNLSDRLRERKRFLEAVVAARHPIKARNLKMVIERELVQKRLERLRRSAGGANVSDEQLVEYARRELSKLAGPASRGLERLNAMANDAARAFARAAGLQGAVIGDWVELAHSPGDAGWPRSQIKVQELPKRAVFMRGKAQSWLREKKAYLRREWPIVRADAESRRMFIPNRLKADLTGFAALGSRDAADCVIQIAPIDWLTCLALNSRADGGCLTSDSTVRERWGSPREIVARRGLPGMLVAHIVVETTDRRFLVCQRQTAGMQDEPGTWAASIEERWSAPIGAGASENCEADRHPHDVVRRAVREELGIELADKDIRVLSWGIEVGVLYPGFIALARADVGSWEVEGMRAHASDSNEVSFVSSVAADIDSLEILDEAHFSPQGRSDMRRPWHRTAKARLFTALAHVDVREGGDGRRSLLVRLGSRASPGDIGSVTHTG